MELPPIHGLPHALLSPFPSLAPPPPPLLPSACRPSSLLSSYRAAHSSELVLLEGAGVQSRKQQQHHHHKLEVYTEVLARLHAAEERAPGFDDDIWSHFNRLPAR